MSKKYPTQAELRELFDYHPDGYLVWREREGNNNFNARYAGKMAGCYGLDENQLYYFYKIVIKGNYYSGNRIVWIWHNGDLQDGWDVAKKDWFEYPKIENLRLQSNKNKIRRPSIRKSKNKYMGVFRTTKTNDFSWSCKDLDGIQKSFASDIDAATHYDNVWEKNRGVRPNNTKKRDVYPIDASIAMHIKRGKKNIKKKGFTGVYRKDRKRSYIASLYGKRIGAFETFEEAARAYNIAAYEKYGEHAVLNDIPDPLGQGF